METRESVQNFVPSPKNHVFERRAAGLLHKHAASQKNHVFEPRIGLHGGRTFASTLVTLQICGLIIVVDVDLVTTGTSTSDDQLTLFCYCITALCTLLFSALFLSPKSSSFGHVFEPRIGLHGGRTFASTLVTLQICGLIIVVDVDLVTTSTSTSDDLLTLFCYCITALCSLP